MIILEQFLADQGGSTQQWVKRHQPKSVEDALRLAKDYMVAETELPKQEKSGVTTFPGWAEGGYKGKRMEVTKLLSREFHNREPQEILLPLQGEGTSGPVLSPEAAF